MKEGIGPTISEGHMTDSAFSRCNVNSLPIRLACRDSREEKEEASDVVTVALGEPGIESVGDFVPEPPKHALAVPLRLVLVPRYEHTLLH